MSAPESLQRRGSGGATVSDLLELGGSLPRKHDDDNKKEQEAQNCGSIFCKCLTVRSRSSTLATSIFHGFVSRSFLPPQVFMAVFVAGDITKQLVLGPDVSLMSATMTSSLNSAGAQLKSAASAVSFSFGAADEVLPVGEGSTLAAQGAWTNGWAARTTGGATLEAGQSLFFPVAQVNNSALIASGGANAKLRAMRDLLPGLVVQAEGNASAVLTQGTLLTLRLRTSQGAPEAVRALELSLGAAGAGKGASVRWSEGALLYTVAPGLLTAPTSFQDAQLPLPAPRGGVPWTHVRLRNLGCDAWGHALGDVDCDAASPPAPLSIHLDSITLKPATASARAAATKHLCEPQFLMEGRGLSCLLPDVCPISSLYKPLVLPVDGKYSGLHVGALAGGSKPTPEGGMEGNAQGYRCSDVMSRVTLGCKLARGWSTHKSVYRGRYRPIGGGAPLAVVVKEGGIRYPAPAKGERGVGFAAQQSAAEQRATLQTMWFEMTQEVQISELLSGNAGIPRQLGACVDAESLVATSVQAMGGVHIGTKGDLVALAEGSANPTLAALKLVRSTLSLFHYVAEERYLRLEDLHWNVFDLRGNVITNHSGAVEGIYASDDLSQFSVDSDSLETGFNLMLIDLDKILISHDEELRWYVVEQMMPYVATQLLSPLATLLPGLSVAMKRMLAPDVMLRPPSFTCLIEWAGDNDKEAAVWMASRKEADWLDLPCDPKVYNEGKRSRWENPHYG